jgi:hypothetical protein
MSISGELPQPTKFPKLPNIPRSPHSLSSTPRHPPANEESLPPTPRPIHSEEYFSDVPRPHYRNSSLPPSPRKLHHNVHSFAKSTFNSLPHALSEGDLPDPIPANLAPEENKGKKNEELERRYPFFKKALEEIQEFNKSRQQLACADSFITDPIQRGILGLANGSHPYFGGGAAMQQATQRADNPSNRLQDSSVHVLIGTLRQIGPDQTSNFLNILSELGECRLETNPINSLETHLFKNLHSETKKHELEALDTILNLFRLACNEKNNRDDVIFEAAYKEYKEDKKLALQAFIHLLKVLSGKIARPPHSSIILLKKTQQGECYRLLEEIRGIFEEDADTLIPFQEIGQLLERLILDQETSSVSDTSSRETTPRTPTPPSSPHSPLPSAAKSMPDILVGRPRSKTESRAHSPKQKRRHDNSSEKVIPETGLRKLAHHFNSWRIPKLPIPMYESAPSSSPQKSEESSPQRLSPKVTFESQIIPNKWKNDCKVIEEVLQSEKCSLNEDKSGRLTCVKGKLDEKNFRLILKKIESMIDPTLDGQEFHQQHHQLNQLLSEHLYVHKGFQYHVEENFNLYDAYLRVHFQVLHGGTLFTFEQFDKFRDNILMLLKEKKIPEDCLVDIYGQEINIYKWFNRSTQLPSDWFKAKKILQTPAEAYRFRLTEYNLNCGKLKSLLEKKTQTSFSSIELRNRFPDQSIRYSFDHDFLLEVAKQKGLHELSQSIQALSPCQDDILTLLKSISQTEAKIIALTFNKNPSYKLVLDEFSAEIKEILTQNDWNKFIFLQLIEHLSNNNDAAEEKTAYKRKKMKALLDHPYVKVQELLQLLAEYP